MRATGTSQAGLAVLLGVSLPALQSWISAGSSRREMPEPARRLCRALLADPEGVRAAIER